MFKSEAALDTILLALEKREKVMLFQLKEILIPYHFANEGELIRGLEELKKDGYIDWIEVEQAPYWYWITVEGRSFKRKGGYKREKLTEIVKTWSWLASLLLGALGYLITYFLLK
ncbi:MAG: hypothetical protein POELPBGB_01248 [Bacteroidia bacterium]|nr:hypothetical protein [Bacteroidia bacterium]